MSLQGDVNPSKFCFQMTNSRGRLFTLYLSRISWNLQPKEAKNHRQTRSSAEVEMIEMEVRN